MAKKKSPSTPKKSAKKSAKKTTKKKPAKRKVAQKTARPKPAGMQYIIFVEEGEGDDAGREMYVAPVAADDAAYLRDQVIPTMRPLSDQEYMTGPVIIVRTLARFSYILFEKELYWCCEWEPGFVVVRFSPTRGMAWTGIRSPVPNFGGRKPRKEDVAAYDEDAENPQYNLVFTAWDAQFDADDRRFGNFQYPTDPYTEGHYLLALKHVNGLGDQLQKIHGDDKSGAVAKKCQQNIKKWLGEGIRLNLKK